MDNFDHIECILSGKGTSHDTVLTLFQNVQKINALRKESGTISHKISVEKVGKLKTVLEYQKIIRMGPVSKRGSIPADYNVSKGVFNTPFISTTSKDYLLWALCCQHSRLTSSSENTFTAVRSTFSKNLFHPTTTAFVPILPYKATEYDSIYTTAKKTAEEKKFSDPKPGMDDIFKIAKQLRKGNQDVVGDKCVKDDSGNLSFDNEAKKVAWKQHYERLLNEEFSWNPEDLTADPPIHIDVEMVVKAITKMKTGKAAGPSGIVAERLKASGDTGARLVADLANDMVRNGVTPSDWEDSFIINIFKGKVMLWREVTTEVSNSLIMS